MADSIVVTVTPDGPLKVSNAKTLRYCGEPLEVEGDAWLCRCGQSTNAPFCDGTHRKVGFSGTGTEREPKPITVWEGRTMRTHFNPNACMHVFSCKPLKALREAELAGDDAAAQEIMKVVGECPSGALTFERKTAPSEPEPPERACDVDIMEGGEIRLQAPFDINVELQERQPADRATLCRCGLSKNKPWCDGRHKARKDFR